MAARPPQLRNIYKMDDQSVQNLLWQFLSMVRWKEQKWEEVNEMPKISVESQDLILSNVLSSVQSKRYPPSKRYQKTFLRNIIQTCEDHGWEVSGKVYEMYAEMMLWGDALGDELCYRSYCLCEGSLVVLKESTSLVVGGTTGMRTWEAALHLVEWLTANPGAVESKRVIELGSGLGLVGISALLLFPLTSFTFTDCHPRVLEALRENLQLQSDCFKCSNYSVEELDWLSCNDREPHPILNQPSDLVLASDIVFDTAVFPGLVSVLKCLLRRQIAHKLDGTPLAIISTTVRNAETYSRFKAELDSQGLSWSVLTPPSPVQTLYYDRSQTYEILQLTICN